MSVFASGAGRSPLRTARAFEESDCEARMRALRIRKRQSHSTFLAPNCLRARSTSLFAAASSALLILRSIRSYTAWGSAAVRQAAANTLTNARHTESPAKPILKEGLVGRWYAFRQRWRPRHGESRAPAEAWSAFEFRARQKLPPKRFCQNWVPR